MRGHDVLACAFALLASHSVEASPWAPWGTALNRTGWNVTADSAQAYDGPMNVIDGNNNTLWHTEFTPSLAPLPHTLNVDMQRNYVINGFSVQPRTDRFSNGNIGQHTFQTSLDGQSWTTASFGSWFNNNETKTVYFSNVTARYVRLQATSEAQGQGYQWTSVAELNVFSPDLALSSMQPLSPAISGRWDVTVDFPIVPAAGAVTPSGNVILWSAYRPTIFTGDTGENTGTGTTQTAVWNPNSQNVSNVYVTNTGHDMFCPGISMDSNGDIIVVGGNSNKLTSMYQPSTKGWSSLAKINVGRGYQAQCTLSDGKIFTIGGSWSGGYGGKNGEVYDPTVNKWTNRTGCPSAPMLTNDTAGPFRTDNHAWLFTWQQNTILQAGPSHNMNWYNISGSGSYKSAGARGSDPDAMCGTATMYDAVAGKILTVGGSPSYSSSYATSNANILTIGSPNQAVNVTQIGNMAYARAFHNSVVLPNGQVLVIGGQSYATPFTDTNAAFVSELFDPTTQKFTQVAPIAVPRNYHSIGLLLPDARVLSAGGGLHGVDCSQNHLDGQIFSPPYLFNSDGSAATRPVIISVSSSTVKPGGTFSITTDGTTTTFSMVRAGSATHTVNTDQRRLPLKAMKNGNTYTVTLPADPGVVVPGFWMLFGMNTNGVPSVATNIMVSTL